MDDLDKYRASGMRSKNPSHIDRVPWNWNSWVCSRRKQQRIGRIITARLCNSQPQFYHILSNSSLLEVCCGYWWLWVTMDYLMLPWSSDWIRLVESAGWRGVLFLNAGNLCGQCNVPSEKGQHQKEVVNPDIAKRLILDVPVASPYHFFPKANS